VAVRVYALMDASLREPIDVYGSRAEAERVLAVLLSDEPDWRPMLSIATIELPPESLGLDRQGRARWN
jgi:hypothetical protein